MMNGSHLKQAGMAQPASGLTGMQLAQGPEPTQEMDLWGPVFEAADKAGVQYDPMSVMRDPQQMKAVLEAAAKSDLGATDGGIDLIMGLAEQMNLPSPFRRQQDTRPPPDAPDYATEGRFLR